MFPYSLGLSVLRPQGVLEGQQGASVCKSWGQRPEAGNSLPGDPAAGGTQGVEVRSCRVPAPTQPQDTETRATAKLRGRPFQLSLSGLKVMTPEEQLQGR